MTQIIPHGPAIFARLRRLSGAFLPAVFLAAAATPAQVAGAQAAGVELSYAVWSGGSRVMELSITLQNGGADYSMGMKAELVGPPSWFEDYSLRTRVTGQLDPEAGPQPVAYRTESEFDKKKVKWIELAFQDGVPYETSDPPFSHNTRPEVDEATRAGSRDPLSAVLALLEATSQAGSCAGEEKVFDGRRRFDLKMLERGTAEVRGFGIYKGEALRCAVQLTPVDGYRYDGKDRTEVSSGTQLYLAQLEPGLPLLPVQIDAETSYGTVKIHLMKVKTLP